MEQTTAAPDLPASEDADAVNLENLEDPYPAESLATTLDRMVAFNRRFITHAHESSHDLVALWVASTHAMPAWEWHPRLYITAPQPGCGKTTQAEVMALLSQDSDQTASTSGPGLFRNISANQPTLFIDEAESQFSRNAGRDGDVVNQVINRGYKRGGVVTRSERNVSVKHPVYAAICLVGIDNGTLRDSTRSRCIPVQMVPGKKGERFRERAHAEFAAEVQWHLAQHAMDWEVVEIPDGFGRDTDLWETLYSVAVAAGPEWVERWERAVATHYWPEEVSESAQVLGGVYDYFAEHGNPVRVRSETLVAYLNAREDLPHVTSTRALRRTWLKAYDTPMGGQVKASRSTGGNYAYPRAVFAHAFKTWLPERPAL